MSAAALTPSLRPLEGFSSLEALLLLASETLASANALGPLLAWCCFTTLPINSFTWAWPSEVSRKWKVLTPSNWSRVRVLMSFFAMSWEMDVN